MNMKLMVALVLGIVGASSLAFTEDAKALVAAPSVDADYARGVADAKVAYAQGLGGWYFHMYSNMPNGPDDPVLARERDLFVALLTEKGIKPHASNSACVVVPGLHKYSEGYNSVADTRLREKFGPDYLEQFKQEVARRMKMSPPAA